MQSAKKRYQKPEVSFVDFTLSSSIAETCERQATYTNENTCTYENNGWILFGASNGECVLRNQEEDFCYHNPTMFNNLFGS